MIKEINGNLLETKNVTVICHQCNCQGRMGAGIAKQIANKYPTTAKNNIAYHNQHSSKEMLGTILLTIAPDNKKIINMYAQEYYGKGLQTDYYAFQKCLNHIKEYADKYFDKNDIIGFPGYIGCGLAGGDWTIIKSMLVNFANMIAQNVYIVYFKK